MRRIKSKQQAELPAARRGFTLIEVAIVLVIIVILASLVIPSYQESIRKAKRAEGRAALMQLMQQQERYYSQNTTYIVFSSASQEAREKAFKWFSGDKAAGSAYEISATACAGDTIQNCVLLTARPGTPNVDVSYADPACGNLTLTSAGTKTAQATACW